MWPFSKKAEPNVTEESDAQFRVVEETMADESVRYVVEVNLRTGWWVPTSGPKGSRASAERYMRIREREYLARKVVDRKVVEER